MSQITLYSNHCPQCKYLEALLKKKEIEYQEVNDIDLMISKGFMSMPKLEVDENIMTYSEALKWVNDKK